MPDSSNLINVPVGRLGIIPLQSCKDLGEKVDKYIARWRNNVITSTKII